jgi:hypothetical protein
VLYDFLGKVGQDGILIGHIVGVNGNPGSRGPR